MNGSLPESERSVAEQHISICEGCRLELELVRAIGSQEKAPAVGKDDWTLDRIFGAEKKAGGSAEAPSEVASSSSSSDSSPWGMKDSEAAPSTAAAASPSSDAAADSLFGPPAPAPASSMPSATPDSTTTDSAAEPPRRWGKRTDAGPGEGNSWDFEPTDSKSSMKPPEQSLFFATEALTRRKDLDSKKGSNLKVILWGTGSLVGAALLAVSSWFVLHMNAPAPGSSPHETEPPAAGASGVPAPDVTPTPAPAPGIVQPPANSAPPEETAQPPDNSAQNTPAPPPRTAASSVAPPTMPLGTRATGPATGPGPVTRTTTEHHVVPPSSTPKTVTRPSETRSPASESHVHATAPSTQTPRPQSGPPQPAPANLSDDTSSTDDEDSPTNTPRTGPSTGGNAAPIPKPTHTAPTGMRGSTMWQTQTPKPVEPETEAPAAEVSTPIERLHLATAAAEERGDLDTLRRLRATWKSFMVKIVGPDRARAKREYADCLWAISDLTGKRADQKDTLAAYREYLLGAPAGGADSRSVSRLRQLEDALNEQR